MSTLVGVENQAVLTREVLDAPSWRARRANHEERVDAWVQPHLERRRAREAHPVEDFLFNEFANGRLLGTKTEEAYFVRCDRTTMTQNDLDNGRLVCLIGVAPLRPAEFVIFRIGQKTADARA